MSTPFEETYQEEHQAMQLYDFVAEGTPIEEPTVQSILANKQLAGALLETIRVAVEPVAELEPQQRRRLNTLAHYAMLESDQASLAIWHLSESPVPDEDVEAMKERQEQEREKSRQRRREALNQQLEIALNSTATVSGIESGGVRVYRSSPYTADSSVQHKLPRSFEWS